MIVRRKGGAVVVMHNKGHIRRKLRELPQDTPTPGNPISGATAGKFNCWGTREAQNPLLPQEELFVR